MLGGEPGERSTKLLRRADGTEQVLPAKCDEVEVQPGDMLVYRTAGGGGWKDRLDRPIEAVGATSRSGSSRARRRSLAYGVVVADDRATEAERARQRKSAAAPAFDFGPPLDQVLERCDAETGAAEARAARARRGGGPRAGDGHAKAPS